MEGFVGIEYTEYESEAYCHCRYSEGAAVPPAPEGVNYVTHSGSGEVKGVITNSAATKCYPVQVRTENNTILVFFVLFAHNNTTTFQTYVPGVPPVRNTVACFLSLPLPVLAKRMLL